MIARLRQSKLPKGEFAQFSKSTRLQRTDHAALFPFCLDEWRSLIVRFSLDSEVSLPDWADALSDLKSKLTESPADLVVFPPGDIRTFAGDFRFPERLLVLRRSMRINVDGDSRHAANARLSLQPGLLAQSIRGGDIADSAFSKQHDRNCAALTTSPGFGDSRPVAKIRASARADVPSESINRFLDSG